MLVFRLLALTLSILLLPAMAAPALGGENVSRQLFWGDTHLHTYLSSDAYKMENRLGPEAAYRFARGEEIEVGGGRKARLRRPLDFLVVADHAETLGLTARLAEQAPEALRTDAGRRTAKPPGS